MKKLNLILGASLFAMGVMAQENNVQILVGPDVKVEYQVVNISANGRWACGNVNDGEGRGFIWDLVTDEITQVAPIGMSAPVLDIADDGTLVGLFTTDEATVNGASTESGGYFKDGKWHYLPYCGIPNGISDNGKFITGVATINGSYHSAIWTLDGEFKVLGEGYVSGGYDVNNEGTMVCGYAYHPKKKNRTPVLMTPDSLLLDYDNVGPFSVARSFSPDGNIVLADKVIYNIKEKKFTNIDFTDVYAYEFFRATNAGNAVGYYSTGMGDGNRAAYVKDAKIIDLQEYLEGMGVNLDGWTLLQCTGITADERTFAVNAFDSNSIPRPLIIRLDANLTNPSPVALKANHLEGTDVCRLTWKAPLANVEGVKSYNIWRNGEKIANVEATTYAYYDKKMVNGTYEYAISAVYEAKESEKSVVANVEIKAFENQMPRFLNAVQTGVRDVRLLWTAPLANRPSLKYGSADDEIVSFGGGNYSFEQAVRLEATDLAVYGKHITDVTFYPMSKQNSWTVNFYTAKDTVCFASRKIDDSKFIYGIENTVRLSEPVAIPEGEDIYVGIYVDVTNYGGYSVLGAIFNKNRAGYSDLIRRAGDKDFMSLYENAMSDVDGAYEYPITFPIGVCLGDEASLENNEVASYKLYMNDEVLATTEELKYRKNQLPDGEYTFGVAAVYANGAETAPVEAQFTMKPNMDAYKSISSLEMEIMQENSLQISWEAPLDDDETLITYSGENNAGGLAPSENTGYAAMYASAYNKNKLGNFDGYQITHVRFFPTSDAEFAIALHKDGEEIVWKELERGVDYVKNSWNIIKLDEPITVNAASEYMLILDCYDVTPGEAPIGMDNLPPFKGDADLFSDDNGKSFTAVSSSMDKTGNWMIGLILRSAESKALPVTGYNVYVDRKLATEKPITETSFTTNSLTSAYHQVRVDVVYEGVEEPVQGKVCFIDMSAGIEGTEASVVNVDVTATCITVTGGTVTGITLHATDGSLVNRTAGQTIDIAHLDGGVYVLTAVVDGKEMTRKIVIR